MTIPMGEQAKRQRATARGEKRLDELRSLAEKRGGECLSKKFEGNDGKLFWRCGNGHAPWLSSPANISGRGNWCPACSKLVLVTHTIEEMRVLAANNDGLCLSEKYISVAHELRWSCGVEGHPNWLAKPLKILKGQWCPCCRGTAACLSMYQKKAMEQGGKLLSTIYLGSTMKHLWRCEAGHTFEKAPERVKQGRWCPSCATKKMAQTKRAQATAKKVDAWRKGASVARDEKSIMAEREMCMKGSGLRLMTPFVNIKDSLKWMCMRGHVIDASLGAMRKRKKACQDCAREDVLLEIKNEAKSRGFRLDERSFVGVVKPMKMTCTRCGEARLEPWQVMKSTKVWCKKCHYDEKLREMKRLASEKGGDCLSGQYLGSNIKLAWCCANAGHPSWMANPDGIARGGWCAECSPGTSTRSIDDARKEAQDKGGRCLSEKYLNNKDPMQWECGSAGKHVFTSSFNSVQQGQWCPMCKNKGEQLIRLAFQEVFNIEFVKCHPDWLRRKQRGRPMELDGWNESLKLAFEYQGAQHRAAPSWFKAGDGWFEEQLKRDAFKKKRCKDNGVFLVEVEQMYRTTMAVARSCVARALLSHDIPQTMKDIALSYASKWRVTKVGKPWLTNPQ